MLRSGVYAAICLVVVVVMGVGGQCPPDEGATCPSATNIDRSIAELYAVQKVCIKFLPMTDANKQLDSICTTFFPSPKDSSTFVVYEVRTYTNCSYVYDTYIGANINTGANSYSNPLITYVSNIIGGINCSTFVKYRCNVYGADVDPYVFGQGPIPGGCESAGSCGFTSACMQEALQVIAQSGLPASYAEQQYYVLPCKCPINAITQQLCVDEDNPLYGQQGGACKPPSEC